MLFVVPSQWLGCVADPPPALNSAALSHLALGGAPLEPPFDPDVASYTVRDAELPAAAILTARAADPDAHVDLFLASVTEGVPLPLGPHQDGLPVPLSAGERLDVRVTPSDGAEARTYRVLVLPDDFPDVRTDRFGETSPGELHLGLIEPVNPRVFYLLTLDALGVPTWYGTLDTSGYDLRLGGAGALTYVRGTSGVFLDAETRRVLRTLAPPPYDGHALRIDVHELFELADGTVFVLGNYTRGADLRAYGGGADDPVLHHVVQELSPTGEVRFAWSTEGVVDYQRVPIWMVDPELDAWEYGHLNSVSVDPDDGNLVVSLRIPSQVLKIARRPTRIGSRTFDVGEVVWRLGGPDSPMRFVDDARLDGWEGFAGQHSARPLPGGRLLVFDNAMWRVRRGDDLYDQQIDIVPTGRPRAVAYLLDEEAGTATWAGEFAIDADPIRAGGSVQRLDDGHTLIGWGDLSQRAEHPAVTELDADGEVVREVWLPPGQWSYRAWLF